MEPAGALIVVIAVTLGFDGMIGWLIGEQKVVVGSGSFSAQFWV